MYTNRQTQRRGLKLPPCLTPECSMRKRLVSISALLIIAGLSVITAYSMMYQHSFLRQLKLSKFEPAVHGRMQSQKFEPAVHGRMQYQKLESAAHGLHQVKRSKMPISFTTTG